MCSEIEKSFRQYTADRIFIGGTHATAARKVKLLQQGNFSSHFDLVTENLIARYTSYIHGLPKERIFIDESYPETWWDAFKERWYPNWAKRRWPVKMKRICVDKVQYLAVCPHIDDADKNPHLVWLAQKHDEAYRAEPDDQHDD